MSKLVDVNTAVNDHTSVSLMQQLLNTSTLANSTLVLMNATLSRLMTFQAMALAMPVWSSSNQTSGSSSAQYGLSSVAAVPT